MSVLADPLKHSWLAFKFTYGDPASPTYSRYTDYPSSIIGPDQATYASRPEISIDPIKYGGGFDEEPVIIKMLKGSANSFTDLISNGEPHSPVVVEIWEILDPSSSGTPRESLKLFKGDVQYSRRNVEGKEGLIEIAAVNLKSKLNTPLGIVATPHCAWNFTLQGCFYDTTGLEQTGTLTAKSGSDGMIVTITGLPARTGKYWHRGYVEVDGLRIVIRDWDASASTTFCLVKEPPTRWVGASVKVFPGCDKTLTTCRSRWNNESNFGGFGFAIPAYNPIYEDGAL